ncbi:IclR family transcriptional regulator [Natronoglomus mannanivorans]|uniref:IclR family transcriptional regulator n=1 Tax=Natronoglomus mannanivorans TaxID=2979990 RepID=A0AAP2Z4W8_9EURY|nr:IclR family transcriptional regulator [Halobacteria archaeon AArc-xg1-1]
MTENADDSLKSVAKAFKIVGYIQETGRVTPTQLASDFDLPTSTAHIYLKTMEEAGYLTASAGQYRLSLRFLSHGVNTRRQFDIYEVAIAEIDRLADATGEVANLGVEEDGKRVLLYKREGEEGVYDKAPTGEFTHMHWTSLGKAILAHLPPDRVDEIVDQHGLPSATDRTITDRETLASELESIRSRGYALEDEERRTNIRAVAVPVFANETVVGSISLSGPVSRFTDARIENELVEELQDKANVIELHLRHY